MDPDFTHLCPILDTRKHSILDSVRYCRLESYFEQ